MEEVFSFNCKNSISCFGQFDARDTDLHPCNLWFSISQRYFHSVSYLLIYLFLLLIRYHHIQGAAIYQLQICLKVLWKANFTSLWWSETCVSPYISLYKLSLTCNLRSQYLCRWMSATLIDYFVIVIALSVSFSLFSYLCS